MRPTQLLPLAALPLLAVVGLATAAPAPAPNPAAVQFFETHVRPVLVERCYACHSAKSPKVQGGLSLDTRQGWQRGGTSGPAIVPGDPDKSLLIRALRYDGPVKMPPAGKLPDKEIAALTQWVKAGAPDPREGSGGGTPVARKFVPVEEGRKRWAFLPLLNAQPPKVNLVAWLRTPVDRFILAKLEKSGLRPNPYADRRTLIRRAYFDLIGLPPTPEEVQAFESDRSPGAWSKVLDHLLASPHYGERWGRHWLDLARFAESHGYEQDYDRPYAYHYRDFVIKALNQDMPYDQFVKWQIAGDEYAPEDPLALTATGFLGAGTHATQITKNQVEKERYDELDDMAATVGTSMLGLTIGCARCHDHKFDPIPTNDYYRLLSTFTTTVRSDYDVDFDPQGYRTAKAAFDKEHAPLAEALANFEREQLPGHMAEWLKNESNSPRSRETEGATWQIPTLESYTSAGGATLTPLDDGSVLAGGKNPDNDTYTFVVRTRLTGITGVRLEALSHASFVKGGPGRAVNGNFALSDFRVSAAPSGVKAEAVQVKLTGARADFEQGGLPVAATIDGDQRSAWAVDPQFGKDHAAVFRTAEPLGYPGGTILTFTLKFENNTGHNIGRPRISLTTAPGDVALDGQPQPEVLARVLAAGDAAKLSDEDRADLLKWFRPLDPEWRKLNARVQEHLAKAPQPRVQKAMICSEGVPAIRLHTQGGDFLPETHFLQRGDPNRKLAVATQGFLTVLERGADEKHWEEQPPVGWRTSYRRRSLANWITDSDKGAGMLLARVIVNRLWQHHMGRGIVATPSDFGAQGDPPTHPELLDFLARELIRGGWRLKPIHRLIMTSATFMQSAAVEPAKVKVDPANKLCWHHPRQRVEAEVIRDSMLAVSGMLDETMFGPGTLDDGMKRRSIYFMIKRSQLIPMMTVFDAPDSLVGMGVRPSTTVAPQALLMLNNTHVREWARAFARRIAPRPETPVADSVRRGYLVAVGRQPTAKELAESTAFVNAQAVSYRASGDKDAAGAALEDFCQVLMGLNEFVYID